MKRKRSRESEGEEDDTAGHEQDLSTVSVSKIINLDTEGLPPQNETTIPCSLPGHAHGTKFSSYADYEKHYVQAHSNRCHECGKNFPTSHFLSLHIQEHHDALIEVRREKGGFTYACFVEVCEDKFQTYKEREEHLVLKHTYPKDYFFAVTKFGMNSKRKSMLVNRSKDTQRKEPRPGGRKPKGRAAKPVAQGDVGESKDVQMADSDGPREDQQEVTHCSKPVNKTPLVAKDVLATTKAAASGMAEPAGEQEEPSPVQVDTEMEDLAGAMSSLRFVPRAVRLGPQQKARR